MIKTCNKRKQIVLVVAYYQRFHEQFIIRRRHGWQDVRRNANDWHILSHNVHICTWEVAHDNA